MADFTKTAIRKSFLRFLNEKPLKQISVRDIVEDCGINRNTFYYHFQDIPQLLLSIIKEDAERIISQHSGTDSLEEGVDAVEEFCMANRNAVMHIYRSVSREAFEHYTWEICDHAVGQYLEAITQDRQLSWKNYEVIRAYMKCVLFGIVMGWLEHGMKDDIRTFTRQLCRLKLRDLEALIDQGEIL